MLSARDIRALAAELDIRPTKQWGQNFVIDANTVERIVRLAEVGEDAVVVEIGPGLGSLTLALLPRVHSVVAVEVDPTLATALPDTVGKVSPAYRDRLTVVHADAMKIDTLPGPAPTALVANLPYNVSVPVVLRFLEWFPSIRTILVMVQLEVAQRLAAAPGSKIYGVPSLKAAWYADVRLVGTVSRSIFWPVPNVDSGLVRLERREPPQVGVAVDRAEVFTCIDAAFAQRRKTLRAALAGWAGSPADAEAALVAAGVSPQQRGEQLTVEDFARIVAARGSHDA
ncbi:MAG TPA: 16S rRNA (adenine(1518)-N(6)/adenine(1519)-N(6))-dimethyltransferase RsmA [Intrasporangiaceae bacterium]|nr:16S rRNA (adenine(1518)-N(6)/adenine(1519)-N(6))-dimethyltransferase RsmA [Intrasporangiaceae bacterium]